MFLNVCVFLDHLAHELLRALVRELQTSKHASIPLDKYPFLFSMKLDFQSCGPDCKLVFQFIKAETKAPLESNLLITILAWRQAVSLWQFYWPRQIFASGNLYVENGCSSWVSSCRFWRVHTLAKGWPTGAQLGYSGLNGHAVCRFVSCVAKVKTSMARTSLARSVSRQSSTPF